jgi:phosphoserine phosphatase
VASWRGSISPHSGGTVPDSHRSSLTARRFRWESSIVVVARLALALDLDGVLADTRPLWDAWLEDATRRLRVELDLPPDRVAAAAALDEALGEWRPLLARFAADRAPLWVRPRAETNALLRRLVAAGARIGVFSDAPRELAEITLAHAGVARQVEVVGTLAEVQEALGRVVVVRSRRELAALR